MGPPQLLLLSAAFMIGSCCLRMKIPDPGMRGCNPYGVADEETCKLASPAFMCYKAAGAINTLCDPDLIFFQAQGKQGYTSSVKCNTDKQKWEFTDEDSNAAFNTDDVKLMCMKTL